MTTADEVVATPQPGPLSYAEQQAYEEFRRDPTTFFRRGAVLAVDLPEGLGRTDLTRLVHSACSRHDVLRTAFDTVGGVPTRTVLPVHRPVVRDGPPGGLGGSRDHLLPEDLVRVWAARGPHGGPRLTLGLHEMVSDPWSCARLRAELLAEADGRPIQDGPAPGYAAYAREERDRPPDPATADHWRRIVDEPVPSCPFPDGPDPDGESAGERILVLPDELSAAVRAICRRHRMSAFMVVTTLTALAAARAGAVRDIALTTMVSGRTQRWQRTLGNFANVCLLRLRWSDDPSLGEAFSVVRDGVLTSVRHQPMPFTLVADLARRAGNPLPDRLLRVHYLPAGRHHYGSTLDSHAAGDAWTEDVDFAGWPLDVGFAEDSRRRVALWTSYDATAFRHRTVAALMSDCVSLLGELADGGDPGRRGLL